MATLAKPLEQLHKNVRGSAPVSSGGVCDEGLGAWAFGIVSDADGSASVKASILSRFMLQSFPLNSASHLHVHFE
jgi:hypothetical protein